MGFMINSHIYQAAASVFHVSVGADWEGATVKAAYTFSAGSIQPDGTDSGVRTASITFPGDFEITQTMTTIGTEFGWGVYDIADDATFSDTLSWGNLRNLTSWFWQGSTSKWANGGVDKSAMTLSNGDTTGLKRVGSTIYGYKNGAIDHTFVSTSSNEMRLIWGCGEASTPVCNNLQWTGGA